MPRTTLNLDAPVLKDLKRLQKRDGRSLGRIASELLARALGEQSKGKSDPPTLEWISRPMGSRVDLTDKEAVRRALEEHEHRGSGKA